MPATTPSQNPQDPEQTDHWISQNAISSSQLSFQPSPTGSHHGKTLIPPVRRTGSQYATSDSGYCSVSSRHNSSQIHNDSTILSSAHVRSSPGPIENRHSGYMTDLGSEPQSSDFASYKLDPVDEQQRWSLKLDKATSSRDKENYELQHERPFRCKVSGCGRANRGFTTINDLHRHQISVHRVGSSEQSYQCASETCRNRVKIWPRLDNFKQHIHRMHKEEDEGDLIHRSRCVVGGAVDQALHVEVEVPAWDSTVPVQTPHIQPVEIIKPHPSISQKKDTDLAKYLATGVLPKRDTHNAATSQPDPQENSATGHKGIFQTDQIPDRTLHPAESIKPSSTMQNETNDLLPIDYWHAAAEEILQSLFGTILSQSTKQIYLECLGPPLNDDSQVTQDAESSTSTSNSGSPPSNTSRPPSSSQTSDQSGTTKRVRSRGTYKSSNPGSDPDSEDSDNDNGRPRKLPKRVGNDRPFRRLKCPFFQRQPEKHGRAACRGAGFADMAKLKDHIKRAHTQPLRCPRCWADMESEASLIVHLQADEMCKKRPQPSDDRIPMHMLDRLDFKRAPYINVTGAEEKWKILYNTLFPDDKDIPSPYEQHGIDPRLESCLAAALDEEIRDELSTALGPIFEHIRSRIPEIIRKCSLKLLQQYSDGVEAPKSQKATANMPQGAQVFDACTKDLPRFPSSSTRELPPSETINPNDNVQEQVLNDTYVPGFLENGVISTPQDHSEFPISPNGFHLDPTSSLPSQGMSYWGSSQSSERRSSFGLNSFPTFGSDSTFETFPYGEEDDLSCFGSNWENHSEEPSTIGWKRGPTGLPSANYCSENNLNGLHSTIPAENTNDLPFGQHDPARQLSTLDTHSRRIQHCRENHQVEDLPCYSRKD